MIYSFDVGKYGVGCACYSDAGELLYSWYQRAVTAVDTSTGWAQIASDTMHECRRRRGNSGGFYGDTVVLETMELHKFSKSRPADILNLQGIAGAFAGAFGCLGADVVGYAAAVWKGQVPRDVMAARVAMKVRLQGWTDRVPETKRKVLNKDELNDVQHAIGLGAYHLEATGTQVWLRGTAANPHPGGPDSRRSADGSWSGPPPIRRPQ